MVVYWTAFLLISYCSVLLSMLNSSSYKMSSSVFNFSIWSFVFCGLLFLVGLRHEVGGDWDQYLSILDSLRHLNEFDTNIINSLLGDPGYQLIMHISLNIGAGIYGVNLLCAIIFLSGLFFFASQLPKPMLAIAVAFPYLILIVGMGYTRQSAGIGFVMASLIYFIRQENLKFILLVIAGALLHKSAIIFLGLMFFNKRKLSFFRALIMILFFIIISLVLIAEALESMFQHYILEEYNADGAAIRLLMNALCGAGLLIRLDKYNFSENARTLVSILSKTSIVMFLLIFSGLGDVVLDRLSLYLIPIQLIFLTSFSSSINLSRAQKLSIDCIIIFLYSIVLYTWLNFATHSNYWLPYNNIINNPLILPNVFID